MGNIANIVSCARFTARGVNLRAAGASLFSGSVCVPACVRQGLKQPRGICRHQDRARKSFREMGLYTEQLPVHTEMVSSTRLASSQSPDCRL